MGVPDGDTVTAGGGGGAFPDGGPRVPAAVVCGRGVRVCCRNSEFQAGEGDESIGSISSALKGQPGQGRRRHRLARPPPTASPSVGPKFTAGKTGNKRNLKAAKVRGKRKSKQSIKCNKCNRSGTKRIKSDVGCFQKITNELISQPKQRLPN